MPITLRSVKGSELTHEELDGNFEQLVSDVGGKSDSGHTHTDLHAHTNKATLDKIGETAGAPTWDGGAWPGGGGGGGSGADPEGWELVETVSWASPLQAVDIALPWATYDEIMLVGVVDGNASGGSAPNLTFSVDDGATFVTAARYGWSRHSYNVYSAVAATASASDTKLPFAAGALIDRAKMSRFRLRMSNTADPGADGEHKYATAVAEDSTVRQNNSSSANAVRLVGHGVFYSAAGPSTHIRLTLTTNASWLCPSGTIRVLGRKLA